MVSQNVRWLMNLPEASVYHHWSNFVNIVNFCRPQYATSWTIQHSTLRRIMYKTLFVVNQGIPHITFMQDISQQNRQTTNKTFSNNHVAINRTLFCRIYKTYSVQVPCLSTQPYFLESGTSINYQCTIAVTLHKINIGSTALTEDELAFSANYSFNDQLFEVNNVSQEWSTTWWHSGTNNSTIILKCFLL